MALWKISRGSIRVFASGLSVVAPQPRTVVQSVLNRIYHSSLVGCRIQSRMIAVSSSVELPASPPPPASSTAIHSRIRSLLISKPRHPKHAQHQQQQQQEPPIPKVVPQVSLNDGGIITTSTTTSSPTMAAATTTTSSLTKGTGPISSSSSSTLALEAQTSSLLRRLFTTMRTQVLNSTKPESCLDSIEQLIVLGLATNECFHVALRLLAQLLEPRQFERLISRPGCSISRPIELLPVAQRLVSRMRECDLLPDRTTYELYCNVLRGMKATTELQRLFETVPERLLPPARDYHISSATPAASIPTVGREKIVVDETGSVMLVRPSATGARSAWDSRRERLKQLAQAKTSRQRLLQDDDLDERHAWSGKFVDYANETPVSPLQSYQHESNTSAAHQKQSAFKVYDSDGVEDTEAAWRPLHTIRKSRVASLTRRNQAARYAIRLTPPSHSNSSTTATATTTTASTNRTKSSTTATTPSSSKNYRKDRAKSATATKYTSTTSSRKHQYQPK